MDTSYTTEITTHQNLEDLILDDPTNEKISALAGNFRKEKTQEKDGAQIVLFYGPPGTGKTLAATLLGKSSGMKVYRVDLSLLVSKYIHETEKKLDHVFEEVKGQQVTLFFDEADSLFGKRTGVNDSHDRYANATTNYLLQKIEAWKGAVIFSTTRKPDPDDEFMRRCRTVINFPLPAERERIKLWEQYLPAAKPADSLFFAAKYEISGGAIKNISRSLAKSVQQKGGQSLDREEAVLAIDQELKNRKSA